MRNKTRSLVPFAPTCNQLLKQLADVMGLVVLASFTIADIPASGKPCRSRRQLTPTPQSHPRASKLAVRQDTLGAFCSTSMELWHSRTPLSTEFVQILQLSVG